MVAIYLKIGLLLLLRLPHLEIANLQIDKHQAPSVTSTGGQLPRSAPAPPRTPRQKTPAYTDLEPHLQFASHKQMMPIRTND